MSTQSEFQTFTNLYNHNLWKISANLNISSQCSTELKNYLLDLKESKHYAIKVSDASGRYRGDFIMQNNFWLGSKTSCKEIDKVVDPGFSFFVANILIQLEMIKNETRLLQLGQCLPKSCSTQDVGKLLEEDSNAKMLTKSFDAKFEIVKVRNVPGRYQLFKDHKFIYFV